MTLVSKHTRAGNEGKKIECPHCGAYHTVGHFAWSAVGCQECKEIVDKTEWLIVPKSKKMNGKKAKEAWLAGYRVYWMSDIYTIFQDNIGQWLNECVVNGSCVGVGDTEGGYYTHGLRKNKDVDEEENN